MKTITVRKTSAVGYSTALMALMAMRCGSTLENTEPEPDPMELPTIRLTQEQFDELPVSTLSTYDQDRCRYETQHSQWIFIDQNHPMARVALIEIVESVDDVGIGRVVDWSMFEKEKIRDACEKRYKHSNKASTPKKKKSLKRQKSNKSKARNR